MITPTRDIIILLKQLPNLTSSAPVPRQDRGVLRLRVAAHVVELLEAPLLGHLLRSSTLGSYEEEEEMLAFASGESRVYLRSCVM